MSIVSKDKYKKIEIDLTSHQGNAFFLIGSAKRYAKQLSLDDDKIIKEMREGDYDNLILTFDKYFGEYINLLR